MKVDTKLVIRAREGDREAFSEIYYACYKDMYNFAFYTFGNPEDAADVVSDTFVEILKGIGKLRAAESFAPWAFKILSGRCKKEISARIRRRGELPFEDFSEMPSFGSENLEGDIAEKATLAKALSELEPEERIILILSALYGYTHREIAKIFGIPRGTVSSKLHRIYAKLRRRLCEK